MSARRPKARRATTGQQLVPIRDPLWDSEVHDILSQVIYYNRPQDGEMASPEIRRMIAIHAESRLQKKVYDLEVKTGYVALT